MVHCYFLLVSIIVCCYSLLQKSVMDPTLSSKMTSMNVQDKDAEELSDIECDVCGVKFSGVLPYEMHVNGQKHRKMLKKLKVKNQIQLIEDSSLRPSKSNEDDSQDEEDFYETLPNLKPFAKCTICAKAFSGPEGYQQHMTSSVHLKKTKALEMEQKLSGNCDEQVSTNVDRDIANAQQFAKCKVCEKSFNSPISYKQHLISKSHSKKIKEMEKEKQMTSYRIDSEDEGYKYRCQTCDIILNCLNSLEQHLSGNYHAKEKKKQSVLAFLSSYPEIISAPHQTINIAAGSTDGGPTYYPLENTGFFVCEICHFSFSGPESAKAHVLSKKHAKAKYTSEKNMQIQHESSAVNNGNVNESADLPESLKNKAMMSIVENAKVRGSNPASDEEHLINKEKPVSNDASDKVSCEHRRASGSNTIKKLPNGKEEDFEIL